jgi:AsmA protein
MIYTALQAHAVLANGVLTVAPASGELPGGSVSASAAIDAAQEPAAESLSVTAPALALAPFLKMFGLPNTAEGIVQAKILARSTGDDTQAMAKHINGQIGLATVNGSVDGTVLNRLFGTALQTVGLPGIMTGAQGPVAVRCAGLRVDATNGIGTIKTLTLDSSRLLVQGGGIVNLGDQTMDILLKPQMQVAGTEISLPVQITGSFGAPKTTLAPADAVQAAGKDAAGLTLSLAQRALGSNTLLGKAAGLLGLSPSIDTCPAALSLARLGQPGPDAPPMHGLPATSTPTANGPVNLLNALMGK